jgi:hypothetical protein
MTISTTTSKVSYTGNGVTTVFAYTFKIFADSEVTVYVDGVLKTLTTHFTVSGAGTASGGNVTFTAGNIPASSTSVVLLRNITKTQLTDYVENDSFPAETHESALDKLTMLVQDVDNAVTGDIFRFSDSVGDAGVVTITKTVAERASKVLAFDTSGDLQATQEIGVYQGNWAASTAYAIRDLIKDTSNNNVYLCNTVHTSSGSQPISSNADVAKWTLIVDAASATTSASSASSSASTATTQAGIATAQAVIATAKAVLTASDAVDTAADVVSAESAKTAAETAYDNFDDRWLGDKSSDPSVDNDGATLLDGAAYFNTSNNVLMVYDLGGTTWNRTTPTSGDQTNINTLSAAAVITDMSILATADIVADMAILGTADVVTDMSVLATADVVTDMNVLATADVVTDMNVLGTADVVADMNTLGTADVVTDMNVLATGANVTAMGLLGNSTTVTNMGLLGTSAVVTDLSILGTADVVADLNTLGTADVVSDLNTLGTADVVSDMNTLGTGANVTAMATCATNEASINRYSDEYTIASSAPSSPSEGDLWYDSTSNVLKVHNGSTFVAVTSATAGITDVADDTTPQLGGDLDLNGNNIDFPTTANISDCIDDDTFGTASATKLATSESIKAYVDAIEASEITTAGVTFSNYNTISGNTTTTTASTKNMFLMGSIAVTGTAVWTIAGNGVLTIL